MFRYVAPAAFLGDSRSASQGGPGFSQHRADLAEFLAKLSPQFLGPHTFGRGLGHSRPKLAELGRSRFKYGRSRATFCRTWPKLGKLSSIPGQVQGRSWRRFRPISDRSWPIPPILWSIVSELGRNLARNRPTLAELGWDSAKFWQDLALWPGRFAREPNRRHVRAYLSSLVPVALCPSLRFSGQHAARKLGRCIAQASGELRLPFVAHPYQVRHTGASRGVGHGERRPEGRWRADISVGT